MGDRVVSDDVRTARVIGFVIVAIAAMFFGMITVGIHDDSVNVRQCIAAGKQYSDGDCK